MNDSLLFDEWLNEFCLFNITVHVYNCACQCKVQQLNHTFVLHVYVHVHVYSRCNEKGVVSYEYRYNQDLDDCMFHKTKINLFRCYIQDTMAQNGMKEYNVYNNLQYNSV